MNQKRAENEEIFNDDDEPQPRGKGKSGGGDDLFNEMRETRTGFGAKGNAGGKKDFKAEGGLQPDDEDEDDEEEEGSDHNF